MSPSDDMDWLAAERALGLLDGRALVEAERRQRADPFFAAAVHGWELRLAPLLDEVPAQEPPAGLWPRVSAAVGGAEARSANDNDGLDRRLRFWRGWSVGATAVAAGLGLFLLAEPRAQTVAPVPQPRIQPQQPESPMIAAMAGKDSPARLVATWEPGMRSLTVAAAGDMPGDKAHSHELWFIVAGHKPRSLGVMPGNGRMHAQLAAEIARALQQGTVLAISVEPAGGSPTGQPTGPVIASGPLLPT